ncbi:hypothetical protein [Intestinibacter bartlettii]|uniref:hypothetical protein n=1 Tax=Intestinibacter bartlettii TaxID=261299 RepID=UPI00242A8D38|nr:hypothetical protein [Intestinibacter bartlettii]MDU6823463.1 hypothetical protein [Intestinibacter bartlettii]
MEYIIEANWYNFKAKFSDNPQKNFEWFCYLLFCRRYNQPEGIFRYKNQAAIETKEIAINGEFIGWQAKFYTDKLSNHKKDLIDTIVDAKKYYKNINKIIFFTNQEWGQGKDGQDSLCKKEVELTGKKLNISIEWKTKSFFESEFVAIQNSDISSHFFCLEDSIIDKLNKIIIPKINELNSEYKRTFNPINNEFINRKEVKVCIENLKQEKSIIMHGKAGQGKSGCTQGIISYCESNDVPYIAIKLDDKMPVENADIWGEKLGLVMSIDKAFDMFSYATSGVMILDQLDALRWTQMHSRQALNICSEIIRRINIINKNRKNKISIIFVCRTYDYENDNSIKLLFKEDKNNQENQIEWIKIEVKSLDEDVVKNIVGYRYNNLSKKMKQLLSIPNNLYIWSQLKEKMYDDYSTTNQLIQRWWKQLKQDCIEEGIDEKEIEKVKSEMIDKIEKTGKLYINEKIIDATEKSLTYLKSCGFLVQVNNNISFSHQSISDYFSAQMMLKRYDDGENIIDIIGDRQKQTPQRRYQVQMLLQDIQESYEEDFINVGIEILNLDKVRFYMKYVFLEVLGQSTIVTSFARDFLTKYCEHDVFGEHILDTVVSGHGIFIDVLIEEGILSKWMQLDSMKDTAINLIISISPNYNDKEVEFIKKYMFKSEEDDKKLYNCFDFDIHRDTDKLFDLRLEFYEKYPDNIYYRLNFQRLFSKYDKKSIKIFELLLKNDRSKRNNYYNEETFLDENNEVFIENIDFILDTLLPYIPLELEDEGYLSKWIHRKYDNTIQRSCVEIIHKANKVMISKNPNDFIERYNKYIGKNYFIYNEIILYGFKELPIDFSTYIISCIVEYFDKIIFDTSSPAKGKLDLTKEILEKHTQNCSEDIFRKLEEKIISYIDPKAKEIYKERIEFNKKKDKDVHVYWNFWGDLQIELLSYLDKKRISGKSKDLLKVLNRRGYKNSSRYNNLLLECGFSDVCSPVSGKKLNNKQWKNILENKKINNNSRKTKWIEDKKCYMESSIEDFAQDFSSAVSLEPNRFANLLLKINKDISDIYIDSLFNAIVYSDNLNEVPNCTIEKLILRFGYNYTSYRAENICCILSKKEDINWSKDILNILCDIAIKHNNPEEDLQIKSFEELYSYSFSSVRGSAARAIGDLLWKDINLFNYFKQIIEILCNDTNPIVRLAAIYILYPVYNIDREFARTNIISILEKDYRVIGYLRMKNMYFLLYEDSKEYIDKAVLKCYSSKDKHLIGNASYIISEMYIRHRRYESVINSKDMNTEQAKYIIEMAIIYINKKEYSKVAKELIKKILDLNIDIENVLSRIFYDNLVDLKKDKDFIIDVVKSHMGRKIVRSFAKYVEENVLNIIEYSDIILALSFNIVLDYPKTEENYWGLATELSTLIIRLYDQCYQSKSKDLREVADKCLEIWDLMFEKRIGVARILTQHMLDR